MSTKLPKKVKIGYADFKVRHVARKSAHTKDMGECDFTNHVITLFGNQATSEKIDSLLHECMHGIIHVFNIKFRSAREEERYVRHFTNGLTTLFSDNPELLEYLKSSLEKPLPICETEKKD